MKRAALLSVSDRTGLADFAKALSELGYHLIGTSGSAKAASESGASVQLIEEYTGQKEILGGRVKTLHPKIHAGLLARRHEAGDRAQLEQDEILPIDIAVVNLYPFEQHLKSDTVGDPKKMVEFIDIGGPTMIRAAAKNFSSVYAVVDPADYDRVVEVLKAGDEKQGYALRRELAGKVFTHMAQYNLSIATYLSNVGGDSQESLTVDLDGVNGQSPIAGRVLRREQELRYGENPHQKAGFYRPVDGSAEKWSQLSGKELSYNNLLDVDAAVRIARLLPKEHPSIAIIKHLGPCGAAIAVTLSAALAGAKRGDPRSHFGGIITANRCIDDATAQGIAEHFTEIVVAPEFSEEALEILKKKKNVRLITADISSEPGPELRSVFGGVLVQESDRQVSDVSALEVMTTREPSRAELSDLQFAWSLCASVKSNAITIVKDGVLLAAGGGQTSRIDAVEVALLKAKTHDHDLSGSVAASDAFFPFTDCVDVLAAAGVTAIVVPSGAKRDEEVIAAANKVKVSILFAPDRHFRH